MRHAESFGGTKAVAPVTLCTYSVTSGSAIQYRASWLYRTVGFNSRYSISGILRLTDVRSRAIMEELSTMFCMQNVISPLTGDRKVWAGGVLTWRWETQTLLVALASRRPTRRTPYDLSPARHWGRRTWYDGDWESWGGAVGPSPTGVMADVVKELAVRWLAGRGLERCPALLRCELLEVLPSSHLRDWIAIWRTRHRRCWQFTALNEQRHPSSNCLAPPVFRTPTSVCRYLSKFRSRPMWRIRRQNDTMGRWVYGAWCAITPTSFARVSSRICRTHFVVANDISNRYSQPI